MRIFIAFKVPQKTSKQLQQFIQRQNWQNVEKHIRWVLETNYHVTLVFIGQIKMDVFPSLAAKIQIIAKNYPAFPTKITHIGFFPTKKPVVLAAKLDLNKTLQQLHIEINQTIAEMGLHFETRAYQPHITLARIKSRIPDMMFDDLEFDLDIGFNQIAIMESVSTKNGVVYKPLHTFSLL